MRKFLKRVLMTPTYIIAFAGVFVVALLQAPVWFLTGKDALEWWMDIIIEVTNEH